MSDDEVVGSQVGRAHESGKELRVRPRPVVICATGKDVFVCTEAMIQAMNRAVAVGQDGSENLIVEYLSRRVHARIIGQGRLRLSGNSAGRDDVTEKGLSG